MLAWNKAFVQFSLSPFSPLEFISFFKMSNDVIFQEQLQIHALLYFLSTFKSSWTLTFTQTITDWMKQLLVWFAFSIAGNRGRVAVVSFWFRPTPGNKAGASGIPGNAFSAPLPPRASKVCWLAEVVVKFTFSSPLSATTASGGSFKKKHRKQTKSGTESWKKDNPWCGLAERGTCCSSCHIQLFQA